MSIVSILDRLFVAVVYCLLLIFFFSKAAKFQSAQECMEYARQVIISPDGRIHAAFFVPDDRVKMIMLGLINKEQKSIKTAQFRVIDKDIAQALIDAHKRRVSVQVIVDHSCVLDQHEKVSWLAQEGIMVKRYFHNSTLMHNKFWIFGNNFLNRKILVTGSANATRSGLTRNQENILVLDDPKLTERFSTKFTDLWDKTIQYTGFDHNKLYHDHKHLVKHVLRTLRVIF